MHPIRKVHLLCPIGVQENCQVKTALLAFFFFFFPLRKHIILLFSLWLMDGE